MDTITRNVRDIIGLHLTALEQVIGHPLAENQQVIIEVCRLHLSEKPAPSDSQAHQRLPDWCNVYERLSDEKVHDLEATILTRAELIRASE